MIDIFSEHIQRIWFDPVSTVVHAMDDVIPYTFTRCGVGMSTGLKLVNERDPPMHVTCLDCLAKCAC